jgi:hypothetical protein
MSSINTTRGASGENMTDVGKISSLIGGGQGNYDPGGQSIIGGGG